MRLPTVAGRLVIGYFMPALIVATRLEHRWGDMSTRCVASGFMCLPLRRAQLAAELHALTR